MREGEPTRPGLRIAVSTTPCVAYGRPSKRATVVLAASSHAREEDLDNSPDPYPLHQTKPRRNRASFQGTHAWEEVCLARGRPVKDVLQRHRLPELSGHEHEERHLPIHDCTCPERLTRPNRVGASLVARPLWGGFSGSLGTSMFDVVPPTTACPKFVVVATHLTQDPPMSWVGRALYSSWKEVVHRSWMSAVTIPIRVEMTSRWTWIPRRFSQGPGPGSVLLT